MRGIKREKLKKYRNIPTLCERTRNKGSAREKETGNEGEADISLWWNPGHMKNDGTIAAEFSLSLRI